MREDDHEHEEPWRLERHMGIAPYPHDGGAEEPEPEAGPQRFAREGGAPREERPGSEAQPRQTGEPGLP